MMEYNVSLRSFNSFGIDVSTKAFARFNAVETLQELLDQSAAASRHPLILGGGSNILFTKNYDGCILKNEISGIEKIKEDDDNVWVRVGAGENWHLFVMYCIQHNYAGVENLSLIPGCAGASPMQNIGAYGVEIKDVFDSLEAYHIKDRSIVSFNNADCQFGYRESVFKCQYKNQFVITHVTFKLNKRPVFHTSYGAIQQELDNMGVQELSIKAISDAVIHIRQSKLPDPAVVGNAGSFFKNPTISSDQYLLLKDKFPAIPGYEQKTNDITSYKVPAGWLIEQCGWKGYRKNDAGVHPKQALVLVNYAHASGKEIYDLSTEVKNSVYEKFGIELERGVNIV
jgi:UDP-N-acetylmuramate dehydrogenase